MGTFGESALYLLLGWPGGDWQTTVRFLVAGLITYYVALWAGMVWWTYRDSRERTRDPFMQALAVFLVLFFSFAGLVIYLMTRPRLTLADAYARTLEEEALLQELEDLKACPTCRRRVEDDYIVCPTCETQLKEPCSRCSKPLSYSWAACPSWAQPRRGATQTRRAPAAAAASENGEVPTEIYRRPPAGAGTPAAAAATGRQVADGESLPAGTA
ncbi:MAG: zinc ribbon domain-containing protein [Dehalococcoidia bacterium]